MDTQTSSKVLVALSAGLGIVVALLAILGSGAVGMVAGIGGIIIGGLWLARGLFSKERNQRND